MAEELDDSSDSADKLYDDAALDKELARLIVEDSIDRLPTKEKVLENLQKPYQAH